VDIRASIYKENVYEHPGALILGDNGGGDSYRLVVGNSSVLSFDGLSF
jgi:hypothetical protein